jgi:DNA-directed RNA polymerase subunit RPC12/RpoP
MPIEFVTVVRCFTCGKQVSGVDPELGLVVRAVVECPECLARPQCIACRRVFTSADRQYIYAAASLQVGPFCARCEGVIQIARTVCSD